MELLFVSWGCTVSNDLLWIDTCWIDKYKIANTGGDGSVMTQ